MKNNSVKEIVILGGGTAGWMAASLLAKRFNKQISFTLIESQQIGIIGVGEATVPWIRTFIEELDISEQEFILATNASFKLGIEFVDWYKIGTRYFHPFAPFGTSIAKTSFHHYWAKLRSQGHASSIDHYSIATELAKANKFALPKSFENQPDAARFNYAFHFDAALFAKLLQKKALALGVNHLEGTASQITQDTTSGNLVSIKLDSGQEIHGDFFIDCSGFRGVLIEETLHTGYEDWSQWLPCDRALALPSSHTNTVIESYTESRAKLAGWQWRIPLQHRIGNGYVYSSEFISDDEAAHSLVQSVGGRCLADPKKIKFTTGIRKKTWNKNVFSLGLASGFLEPLESTSIYLIQFGLETLFNYFPGSSEDFAPLANKANRLMRENMYLLRNFLILHYHLNQREGEPFWDYCRHMFIPGSLKERMEDFKYTGNISLGDADFFKLNSWLAIFSGYDFVPEYWHPKINVFSEAELKQELANIKSAIQTAANNAPDHAEFLQKNNLIR